MENGRKKTGNKLLRVINPLSKKVPAGFTYSFGYGESQFSSFCDSHNLGKGSEDHGELLIKSFFSALGHNVIARSIVLLIKGFSLL
jgi:hypothetical protein